MFPSNPLICFDEQSYQLTVSLQDQGDVTTSYIRVIDYSFGDGDDVVSYSSPSSDMLTRDDLYQQIDFWNIGGWDRDFAVIYRHMMQALEFARQVFVSDLDYELPVDVNPVPFI